MRLEGSFYYNFVWGYYDKWKCYWKYFYVFLVWFVFVYVSVCRIIGFVLVLIFDNWGWNWDLGCNFLIILRCK